MDFVITNLPVIHHYKNVNIIDSNVMPCDSVNQIIEAESVINNYAKANNVNVEIFDPRHRTVLQKLAPESDLAACVGVSVYNVKKPYDFKYDVVDYFKNEDVPFIKRVFLSIQKLVEGDGNMPINREKTRSLEQLKAIGKIKA